MAREPVQREQTNSFVHGIKRIPSATGQEILFERRDFPERFRMVEGQQVFGAGFGSLEVYFTKAVGHLLDKGRVEPRPRQHDAERVNVASEGNATQQGSFNESRPTSHEGVVNDVTKLGAPFDEKSGSCGLKQAR